MKSASRENERHLKRYPRTGRKRSILLAKINKLRRKRPAPLWRSKNISNPADLVLDHLLKYSRKKLKRLCRFHSLEYIGGRYNLIKRLYLHWRASKLRIGETYIGYAKGYNYTQTPVCVCGFRLRTDVEREQKINMQAKLNGRMLHAKCRAVFEEYTQQAFEYQRTGVKPMRRYVRIGITRYPRIGVLNESSK